MHSSKSFFTRLCSFEVTADDTVPLALGLAVESWTVRADRHLTGHMVSLPLFIDETYRRGQMFVYDHRASAWQAGTLAPDPRM